MAKATDKTRPHRLRKFFLTGLLFLFPIGVTYWVLSILISKTQGYARPFVERFLQFFVVGFEVPSWLVTFVSLILVLVFTILVGWLASFYFGKKFLDLIDKLMLRLPVVRSVYGGTKQIIDALSFQRTAGSFKKVVMIEYPKKGTWAMGFITNENLPAAKNLFGQPMVSVFMPSTPNPTTGFLLYYDPRELWVLDLSVEEAVKLIVSAGLVLPQGLRKIPYPIAEELIELHPDLVKPANPEPEESTDVASPDRVSELTSK